MQWRLVLVRETEDFSRNSYLNAFVRLSVDSFVALILAFVRVDGDNTEVRVTTELGRPDNQWPAGPLTSMMPHCFAHVDHRRITFWTKTGPNTK